MDLIDEVAGVESLAVDAPVVVGECHHHGIYLVGLYARSQVFERHHATWS